MPTELLVLALAAVLLMVHVMLAGHIRTRQYGTEWNMGARDAEMPPLNPLAGRLLRAQENYQETLPVAVIAYLIVATPIAGETDAPALDLSEDVVKVLFYAAIATLVVARTLRLNSRSAKLDPR